MFESLIRQNRKETKEKKNEPVLCHLATQLDSGSMTAMTPSKWVVVHVRTRSWDCFICIISSQFGQPFLRKSTGLWMIEQRRQARSWRARALDGIEAVGGASAILDLSSEVKW